MTVFFGILTFLLDWSRPEDPWDPVVGPTLKDITKFLKKAIGMTWMMIIFFLLFTTSRHTASIM